MKGLLSDLMRFSVVLASVASQAGSCFEKKRCSRFLLLLESYDFYYYQFH